LAAGLRNILVHRHLEVRVELLHEAARKTCYETAKPFIEWIWIKDVDL